MRIMEWLQEELAGGEGWRDTYMQAFTHPGLRLGPQR